MIAPIIGSTEELIFRGYLQKQLRQIGPVTSIVFASLFHSLYKLVFFFPRESPFEINFLSLVKCTFFVGILFGMIKEYAKNSLAPVCGHAVFNLVVYGDNSIIPWWIWT